MGKAGCGRQADPRYRLVHAPGHTGLAEDVPVESRTPVLDRGFTCWNFSLTLTTTRCAVLFRRLLGVPMVSSEFVTYRDAFLFALSVHWDVDIAKYDLTPEQS